MLRLSAALSWKRRVAPIGASQVQQGKADWGGGFTCILVSAGCFVQVDFYMVFQLVTSFTCILVFLYRDRYIERKCDV